MEKMEKMLNGETEENILNYEEANNKLLLIGENFKIGFNLKHYKYSINEESKLEINLISNTSNKSIVFNLKS